MCNCCRPPRTTKLRQNYFWQKNLYKQGFVDFCCSFGGANNSKNKIIGPKKLQQNAKNLCFIGLWGQTQCCCNFVVFWVYNKLWADLGPKFQNWGADLPPKATKLPPNCPKQGKNQPNHPKLPLKWGKTSHITPQIRITPQIAPHFGKRPPFRGETSQITQTAPQIGNNHSIMPNYSPIAPANGGKPTKIPPKLLPPPEWGKEPAKLPPQCTNKDHKGYPPV